MHARIPNLLKLHKNTLVHKGDNRGYSARLLAIPARLLKLHHP